MKLFVTAVLLLSFIAITTQDITGKKGCDCSICKSVNNKINPLVGKQIGDGGGGKSSCNLCEQRKEMLRLERERQRQMQKCPYELLGSPALKGKSSQEIFDDFREQIVPSQNGFFDMMRGIVRTMHFSSEAELKSAKEKEARELAKKKKEEEEEAKKRKESKHYLNDEIVSLDNPVNPKVTVVVKQTPCGQVIPPPPPSTPPPPPPVEEFKPVRITLPMRWPKEAKDEIRRIPEEEILDLQAIDNQDNKDYLNLDSKENYLHSDLIDQLIGYNMLPSASPQNEGVGISEQEGKVFSLKEGSDVIQSSTEPPFDSFLNDDVLKPLSEGRSPGPENETSLNILTANLGDVPQRVDKENAQIVD